RPFGRPGRSRRNFQSPRLSIPGSPALRASTEVDTMVRSNRRISKSLFLGALFLAVVLFSRGGTYATEGGGYTMEVLVDGIPLQEYAARGTRYIEAVKGREYSVRLCNRTGERVAIAL